MWSKSNHSLWKLRRDSPTCKHAESSLATALQFIAVNASVWKIIYLVVLKTNDTSTSLRITLIAWLKLASAYRRLKCSPINQSYLFLRVWTNKLTRLWFFFWVFWINKPLSAAVSCGFRFLRYANNRLGSICHTDMKLVKASRKSTKWVSPVEGTSVKSVSEWSLWSPSFVLFTSAWTFGRFFFGFGSISE